jgi:S-formylglutathione hydrolase FrmB
MLQYFNPFAENIASPPPQDEDIPAAKQPRIETAVSAAVDLGVEVEVDVAVAAHMPDTVTTASPSNVIAVAPRDGVKVSSPLQSTEAPRAHRVRRKWTAEADAKLTDGVAKHGNNWVAIAAIIPG